jgi:hypothetical protein
MDLREVLSTLVIGNGIACGPDLMRILDGGYTPDTDRRRRVRLPLAWVIYVLRSSDTSPVETKTKNISSEGFYCYVHEALVVGECIRCTMVVPGFEAAHRDECISLECQATVLRVEAVGPRYYGVACHIDTYKMVTTAKRPDTAKTFR